MISLVLNYRNPKGQQGINNITKKRKEKRLILKNRGFQFSKSKYADTWKAADGHTCS